MAPSSSSGTWTTPRTWRLPIRLFLPNRSLSHAFKFARERWWTAVSTVRRDYARGRVLSHIFSVWSKADKLGTPHVSLPCRARRGRPSSEDRPLPFSS